MSTHEFSHFYSFPHLTRGEWASSCAVISCQLGFNNDIPTLGPHLTHHPPLEKLHAVPLLCHIKDCSPATPSRPVLYKKPASIHDVAPVVSTVWPHLHDDHPAPFACHSYPPLSYLIRGSISLPHCFWIKVLLSRLPACWWKCFCHTWSGVSRLFLAVFNSRKGSNGHRSQFPVAEISSKRSCESTGFFWSLSLHQQDWEENHQPPCPSPSPPEPCIHTWDVLQISLTISLLPVRKSSKGWQSKVWTNLSSLSTTSDIQAPGKHLVALQSSKPCGQTVSSVLRSSSLPQVSLTPTSWCCRGAQAQLCWTQFPNSPCYQGTDPAP